MLELPIFFRNYEWGDIDFQYFSDWEATNEAIEEQVARESYLQWLRDNERRTAGNGNSKSATVTSADLKAATESVSTASPSRAKALKEEETKAARSSPKPGCSHSTSSEPAHYTVRMIFYLKLTVKNCCDSGKSLLELWVTTFLPDWQTPLIFVWFISSFLCMGSNSMESVHVK